MKHSSQRPFDRGAPAGGFLPLLAALLLAAPMLLRAATPPQASISSPTPSTIVDTQTSTVLEQISISDADAGETVTATITFPDVRGTFPIGSGLSKPSAGTYVLSSRTPSSAQTFLRALTFSPNSDRLPNGTPEVTTFTVQITDSTSLSTQVMVNLTVTGTNVAPTVTFSPPAPAGVNDTSTSGRPFVRINVDDQDAGDAVTMRITFPDERGTFPTDADLSKPSAGTYVLSARSPAQAEAFLRTLDFSPATNRIPIGTTEQTTFTVRATDGAGAFDEAATNLTVTPVNDAPHLAGLSTIPTALNDNQSTQLFSGLTITDVDDLGTQHVSIRLLLAESAPGTFSYNGSTYTDLTITDTPANVTTLVRALVFTPSPNRVPPGQTYSSPVTVQVTDSIANAPENGTRSITFTSLNDPPAASVVVAPPTLPDTTDALPFQLTLTDPDVNESLSVVIQPMTDPASYYGTLSPLGPFTGTPEQIQLAVANVRFSPVRNRTTNSQPLDFRFVATDSHSASISTTGRLTVVAVNDPPSITGVAAGTIHITDDTNQIPVKPFVNVLISDPDAGETNVVNLTLSDPAKGTLSRTNFSGSPAQITADLRATTFLPIRTADRVQNQTVTISINIAARDSANATAANNQTTIAITAVNAPPLVSVPTNQPIILPPVPIVGPFTNVVVADDDVQTNGQPANTLKVTVSIDNPLKGALTNVGAFTQLSNGTYQIVTNYPEANRLLTNMLFAVSPTYVFPPNAPGGTRFTIKAVDAFLNQTTRTLDVLLQNLPVNRLVTSPFDDGLPGSLRYAVTNAGNNDVITFALPSYPEIIRLSAALGPMELRKNITFKGPGADLLTISGDSDGNGTPDTQLFRVFASATFDGLTLSKGKGAHATDGPITGGAIFVGDSGRLFMRYCAITESQAAQWGGAIDVSGGSVALDHCLLRGNFTDLSLGLGGGAVSLYTTLPCAFSNTTFAANQQRSPSGFGGGAIYAENFNATLALDVKVLHCTFAQNADGAEVATSISANAFGTTVSIRNSIFKDGGEQNLEVEGAANIVSEGGNISSDSTRTTLTQGGQPTEVILLNQASDLRDTNPKLLPLDLLAKPTAVYPLASDSPAIGHAVGVLEPTDQRGALRSGTPDSGAAEYLGTPRVVLNEINFNPAGVQFLEFYVLRDSTTALDFGSWTVWVDGSLRHQFAVSASSVIQPGRGVIVANSIIPAGDPTNGNPTLVVTPVFNGTSNLLNLTARSRVELREPSGRVVISVPYVGVFSPDAPPFAVGSSLTLLPQFRGCAYVPHSLLNAGATNSPGRDANGTPFGSPNAIPSAAPDNLIVGEDDLITIPVLANDSDADGGDVLFIVDLSRSASQGGNDAQTNSLRNAIVGINPSAIPLRGSNVIYDPRHAISLQSLPEGATLSDEFYYSIVDYGSGVPTSYSSTSNGLKTLVQSPSHRLTNGEVIVISGAGEATYNGEWTITFVGDDSFIINTNFLSNPVARGSWLTKGTRQPTTRGEAKVTLTVIGANDPPTPTNDLVTTTEDKVIRVMADSVLAGTSNVVFDTDNQYSPAPVVSTVSLLNNDSDPDTDDNKFTLHVVGVAGRVFAVSNYVAAPTNDVDLVPLVKVIAPAHGLFDGQRVLISGYGGHPSYNALHVIRVVDANTFIIPVRYVDNDSVKGIWGVLDDATRLTATSAQGAAVKLEIRADRAETSLIYNPRVSQILNHLGVNTNGVPQVTNDTFYYAVQDRHGGIAFGQVTVQVSGVNDIPTPLNDPTSLSGLNSLVSSNQPLSQVVTQLHALYFLPPVSGNSNRVDVQAQFDGQAGLSFFLPDMWTTDEDTLLNIPSAVLLANDSDVDFIDTLRISAVQNVSRQGASVALSSGAGTVVYNPLISSNLNALAREETAFDAFNITVSDGVGGSVTTLVSVLVVGVNDKPVAKPDVTNTWEDVAIAFDPTKHPEGNPLLWDFDVDVNGLVPDNRLSVLPVVNFTTPGGARVDIASNIFHYDPSVSHFLDGLAVGQTFLDTFEYTVTDSSFLFANNDMFKVRADGADFSLDVLKNDVNFNVEGSAFQIVSVGVPNRGGTATNPNGTNIVYTPQINFVGDEVFTYTLMDEFGNEDSALVTVRVTVNQLNGQLQANNDDYSVAKGETVLLDVLANDNIIPQPGSSLTITRVSTPSAGGLASISAGRISYTPDPLNLNPVYTEAFTYEITGGGTATATGLVQIVVTNRVGTLAIQDDAFSVLAASRNNSLNVLLNDGILPVAGEGLKVYSINTNGLHGLAQISTNGSGITYTPDVTFVGEETNLTYVAIDELGGTGSGRVRILVGHLAACADVFVVDSTNTVNLDVLANDRTLQGPASTLTLVGVAPASTGLGTASVVANKLHFVASGAVGESNLVYTVADGAGGTTTGLVTIITIDAATTPDVFANADSFSVLGGTSGNELTVLANDVAVPNFNRPLTIVSVGSGIDAPNHGGVVAVSPASDRLIYTPAPGFSGEETFTYTMTDSRKIDTAKVIVKVNGGELIADNDEFTVFFETNSSGRQQFSLPVMANDRVLPDFGQVLTITGVGINDNVNGANAPSQSGTVEIGDDETTLVYTPRATNAFFVERFTYEITDGTERRAQGVVQVKVQQRANARDIETHDDHFTIAANSGANILMVLANDGVKPASANTWTITGIPAPPSNGVAVVFGPTVAYTPNANFVGTDHFTYTVSDGLGGTGLGVVTVKVGEVNVCPDTFVALSGTTNNLLPVLANDFIAPSSGKLFLVGKVGSPDRGGSATNTPDGLGILYTPNPDYGTNVPARYPYQERFWYDVVDDSGGLIRGYVTVDVFKNDSDRDHATISITVKGVNDAPTITNAVPVALITDKQTGLPFANVRIHDVDDQGMERLTVTVIIDSTAKGVLTNLGGFVQGPAGTYTLTNATPTNATAAIRALVFVPVENRIVVPTTEDTVFTILANDSYVTTTNTLAQPVQAVNDPPTIAGTVSGLRVYHRGTVRPFYKTFFTEVDDSTTQRLVIRVTLDTPNKGYFTALDSFSSNAPGTYVLTNATAASATLSLRGLIFVPTTANRVVPGTNETTRFTVSVNDGFAPAVLDTNTTVTAIAGLVSRNQFAVRGDADSDDQFGRAVSATRDFVAVGMPEDDNNNETGSAFVYARRLDGSEAWDEVKKIYPPGGHNMDLFGFSVGLSGETLVVGAPNDDTRGSDAGAAYIFSRNLGGSNQWGLVAKITAADGASSDEFGSAVAIDGDTIAIGSMGDDDRGSSSGSVYLFARSGTNWVQVRKVTASDGLSGDELGFSIALSGDTLVAGAHGRDQSAGNSGAAYVFYRNSGGSNLWGQVKKLLPGDPGGSDEFGFSVSVDADTIAVGAPFNDDFGDNSGSAYVFARNQGGNDQWGQVKKLLPLDGGSSDNFGYSVGVDDGSIVVGAPHDNGNGSDSGSAYLFARNAGGTNQWGQTEKFLPGTNASNGNFGFALAVKRSTLVIGAPFEQPGGGKTGTIYLYRLKYDNAPMLVTPIPDLYLTPNVPFTYILPAGTFDDPDLLQESLVWSMGPLPSWASFDPSTRTFSALPTLANLGSYFVTLVATDQDQQTASQVFEIEVGLASPDIRPPTMAGPANTTVSCVSSVPAPDFAGGSVTDDTDPAPIVMHLGDTTNGACPIVITRTYCATDWFGNSNVCSQTITVQDTTPPTISGGGSNQVVESGTAWSFTAPSANDECTTANVSVFSTVTNVQCGATYTAACIWLATDACGNTATYTQTVAVIDTTVPAISSPPNATVGCAGDVPAPDFSGGTVSDLSDPAPLVTHLGDVSVGSNPRIITRTYRATDACGNTDTAVQTITVYDTAAPTVTAPADVVVSAETNTCTATNVSLGTPALSDNCTVSATNNAPQVFPLGMSLVTWTAMDAAGNTATSTQRVTVVDSTLAITSQPQSQTNNLGSNAVFSVTATGCAQLTYQWRFGTNVLVGETNATLALTNLQYGQSGDYLVEVSNAGGNVTSVVAVLTVNRPPVANDDSALTTRNQAVIISSAGLLSNDNDSDLDTIALVSVSPTSTNGAIVSWSGGDITYTPVTDFTGVDRFSYTITDGRGATATAGVEMMVASSLPSADNLSITASANGTQILYRGTPGQTYTLQRSLDLRNWTSLFTNTSSHGVIEYVETNAPPSGAFYRVFKP